MRGRAGTLQFKARNHYTFNVLGYDNDIPEIGNGFRGRTLFRATDLRLETVWTPSTATSGSLTLSLGQPRNLVRVRWNSQGLELLRYNATARQYESVESVRADAVPRIEMNRAYQVALDNVDRTVRVFIDNKMVLEHEMRWTAADALEEMKLQRQEMHEDASKPVVSIEVSGPSRLGHLKILRVSLLHAESGGESEFDDGERELSVDAGRGRVFCDGGQFASEFGRSVVGFGGIRRWMIWGRGVG